MARKQHNTEEVLYSLRKKHDVKVNRYNYEIYVLRDDHKECKHDLGNGTWGKIDYLVNHVGFKLYYIGYSAFKNIRV